MKLYRLSSQALHDLNEIIALIEQDNPEAAVRFLDNVAQKCRHLANFPNMGRRWDNLKPPLRSFPVESYLIFYRPIAGSIEVVRVVSGYRDLENLFSTQEDG
ncbi:MAG: type II toxin-antitoxin system RelE/ParE family toxin [Oscillatoriaceae cyanobacterium]